MGIRIRPRRRTGEFERSAKNLVDSVLGVLGFDPALYGLFELCDRETGKFVKNCKTVAVQGSRICIQVPSVVHRQELMYSKKKILEKVNQTLGKKTFSDIRFELEPKLKT